MYFISLINFKAPAAVDNAEKIQTFMELAGDAINFHKPGKKERKFLLILHLNLYKIGFNDLFKERTLRLKVM